MQSAIEQFLSESEIAQGSDVVTNQNPQKKAPSHTANVGDVVQLLSGGVLMTVYELSNDPTRVNCMFYCAQSGEIKTQSLPADILVKMWESGVNTLPELLKIRNLHKNA